MPWLPTKVCNDCGEELPLDEFRQRSAPNQHLHYNACRICELRQNKDWRIKTDRDRKKVLWQYGMTVDQYNKILAEQGGVCKICGYEPGEGEYLAVDHDHDCCPIRPACGDCNRGLLCSRCNKGLGMFRDNSDLLMAAANYLSGGG